MHGFHSLKAFIAYSNSPILQDYAILHNGELIALASWEFHDVDSTEFHLISAPNANRRAMLAALTILQDSLFTATNRTHFYAVLPDEPHFSAVRRFALRWGMKLQADNQTFIQEKQPL
jgi:hypothetical protein